MGPPLSRKPAGSRRGFVFGREPVARVKPQVTSESLAEKVEEVTESAPLLKMPPPYRRRG